MIALRPRNVKAGRAGRLSAVDGSTTASVHVLNDKQANGFGRPLMGE